MLVFHLKSVSRDQSLPIGGRRLPAGRYRRSGFTLLEVLLVVAILVALAAFAVPSLLGTQEGNQKDMAKLNVSKLDSEVFKYKLDTGVFPTTEQGLMAPSNLPIPRRRIGADPTIRIPLPRILGEARTVISIRGRVIPILPIFGRTAQIVRVARPMILGTGNGVL